MATEIFPNEGLAYLLGIVPKGGTSPANLYLGLFTSQTASTVITAAQTLAANITEPGYTNYARVAVASSDWGSVTSGDTVWSQSVSSVQASQKSFAAAGSVQSSALNGFFLASAITGGVCVFQSNWDDQTAIASLALGDIVRITPKFALGG